MKVFLAGGAGYIGSHTALALAEAGYDVVVADDFSNSSPESIRRVEELTGKSIPVVEADLKDAAKTAELLSDGIDCVIHFAGFKAVGESVQKPLEYYRNNLDTTLSLLEGMRKAGVHNIIFSSSATVYGSENEVPLTEQSRKGTCSNPYGWTKLLIEQILTDTAAADPAMHVVLLRYFNPIGAHESGRIGEDPKGIPNNLMPFVTQVAVGKREKLTVFGGDYDTPDGTCLRDYIHVMDLAEGHVKAVQYIEEHGDEFSTEIFNLGTGKPYSVLDIVKTFIRETGADVPYVIGDRRAGDLPALYAKVDKAREVLGWEAKRDLADMCRDSWHWQHDNPDGYR